MQPTKQTLSVREAAELIGLARWSLYKRVADGDVPFFRYGSAGSRNCRLVFDRDELLTWRERHRAVELPQD